jgi:hypothetical protein
MLNEDYKDMLLALSAEKVKFLVVGAMAMAAHGFVRATMDIDFWIMPSPENAEAALRALAQFGAPLLALTREDLEKEGTVFQIGVEPRRIDIMTSVSGLEFEQAYKRSLSEELEGIEVRIPSLDDLIQNKRASGRNKDLVDLKVLEARRDAAKK